jgi:hypothetical protein
VVPLKFVDEEVSRVFSAAGFECKSLMVARDRVSKQTLKGFVPQKWVTSEGRVFENIVDGGPHSLFTSDYRTRAQMMNAVLERLHAIPDELFQQMGITRESIGEDLTMPQLKVLYISTGRRLPSGTANGDEE